MRESHIKTEYGTVYYWATEIDNAKRTLFFLHGLTANHTMFDSQIAHFENACNVIAWDAPAHGKSRPYAEFRYEDAARTMRAILQELKVTDVILIGQSMGGFIAQSFLCRYPKLVRGLIAIDSCPFGDYYSKLDIWWLKQIEWMSRLFPEKLLKSSMAKQNAVSAAGQNNMREMISDYSKKELCHLMGIGYAGFLEDNQSLDITCPALLLVGVKTIRAT